MFCFVLIKWLKFPETWKRCGIEMMIMRNKKNKLEIMLKMHDLQDELGVTNMSDLVIKELKASKIEKEKILQHKK